MKTYRLHFLPCLLFVLEAYRLDRYENCYFLAVGRNQLVLEAYRLDRYENCPSILLRELWLVLEAYRLDRYENKRTQKSPCHRIDDKGMITRVLLILSLLTMKPVFCFSKLYLIRSLAGSQNAWILGWGEWPLFEKGHLEVTWHLTWRLTSIR